MDAVFVTKGQIAEELLERVDAALREEFGALRADAFDHADFGAEGDRHWRALTEFIGCIFFISFLPRTYGKSETCAPGIRTDRVSVPFLKQGGARGGRPSDRFRQARAAFVGCCRNHRHPLCAEIFLPRLSRSVRQFSSVPRRSPHKSAEIRQRPGRERQRLS